MPIRGEIFWRLAAISRKKDLAIARILKESTSILEQASRSYGDLKLGGFFK